MTLWLTLKMSSPFFFAVAKKAVVATKDDAFIISIIGLGTVFSGLLILCFFMIALNWAFEKIEAKGKVIAPEAKEKKEIQEDNSAKQESEEYESGTDWVPPKEPNLVPVTLLSTAIMAYHFYEIGELSLGESIELEAEDKNHKATIISIGYYNRVLVDEEEVVFNLSEVAINDETGQKIIPAE